MQARQQVKRESGWGVVLPFDGKGTRSYFADVDKVSVGLGRNAASMGLEYQDLL